MRGEEVAVNGTAVGNVLVEPAETAPDGPSYTLRLPLGAFPDGIAGAVVSVRGLLCRQTGAADHYRPDKVFGAWTGEHDMTVHVVRYTPCTASISETVSDVDELGDPLRTSVGLYDGPASAKMTAGTRDGGTSSQSDVEETWEVLVPADLAGLRPDAADVVLNDGVALNATSIEPAGSWTVIKGVRRG